MKGAALIAIVDHDLGHRVYVKGLRLHHGLTGAVACAWGVWAMWRDRRDFPWALRRDPLEFRRKVSA